MHDVVIIGAGLCGCWAAKLLAESGVDVLLLEAGPEISAGELTADASRTLSKGHVARRQAIQSRHPSYAAFNPKLFVDDVEHPYRSDGDVPFVWIRGRQVGGRGLTWGGVTLRFSDLEFRAATRDGFGPDWPVTHADLAPYFSEVESFFGVSGMPEGLAQLPDGVFLPPAEITDPEFRFRREVQLRWPDRRVTQCRGISAGTSADVDSEWPRHTPQHRVLPDALRTGRVSLRSNAVVSRLVMDSSGRRVAGVACVDRISRSPFVVRGRATVLCASTIESVRILLNSRSREHPRGVGNSSGLLGTHLMDHAALILAGRIPEARQPAERSFGGPNGVLVPRFRNVDDRRADFLRGYGIWANLGRSTWSSGDVMWSLCAMLEVLPRRENSVEIDEGCVDAFGVPAPVIRFSYSENERRMLEDAEHCMREMIRPLDWPLTHREEFFPGSFVHELGGARMGAEPAQSVVDSWNRCWDAQNLFVLDGSCFVTSGWQNPTLTMLALVGRACRPIAQELNAGDS